MKIFIILLVIGILEVVLVGKLHTLLGMESLILFYLGSTLLGAFIAFIFYTNYKLAKNKANFSNKFQKRMADEKLSAADYSHLENALYCIFYWVGCLLIAVPGLLTDILGITLLIPDVRRFLWTKYGSQQLEKI